jgi:PAS domain S-box-containing protein
MKKGLLVVEANGAKFTTLNKQLTELHYSKDRICRCFSIDESLSHPKDEFFVILADVSSPAASISPSLHTLQKHFRNIPIVVLSDNDDKEDAITAIREGAQDFLVNGIYDAAQLEKAILFATERKALTVKTEYAVKEYKKHFENGPIPMWIIDSATQKFLIVNNAAVEKYGYSKEEFRRMTINEILPPDEKEPVPDGSTLRKKDFYDAGYRKYITKKGEAFYTHIYTHATQFGNIDATIHFAIDVSKKIQVEKHNEELTSQIKAQKEQLESLLYSMGYTIWSRKANTFELVYAYPNNAYSKLFGFTADEMMKDKGLFYNSIHPDDLELVYESLKEANTKGVSEVIFRYVHPSGEIKTLKSQINLKIGSGGNQDMINGVTFDVSKEKQLTETIRNTEQNLLATINNTRDQVWSINSKLEIVFCNKAYQDVIYELAGVIPKPGDYVLGEWGSESFFNTRKKDYERALAGESFTIFVEEFYDGALLHKEISSNPIVDDAGKIVGVICIARDISEQKNQFVQIQKQNEKLREIAWIQSHKVRGPVASILGLASLFNYEAIYHDTNIEILEKLTIATQDLDKIIKEVVDKTNSIHQ